MSEMNDRNRSENYRSSFSDADSNRLGKRNSIKIKTNESFSRSRLLKSKRPSLGSIVNKAESLPNSNRGYRIRDKTALAGQNSSLSTSFRQDGAEPTKLKNSSSSFQAARNALKISFKAARSFLSPSSKLFDSYGKTSLENGERKRKNVKADGREHQRSMTLSDDDTSLPNTPKIIKKSNFERARKRFSSTFSLHMGGSSSGESSQGRSKSASTLASSSDTEIIPNGHGESPEPARLRNSLDVISSSGNHMPVIGDNMIVNMRTLDNAITSKKVSRRSKPVFNFICKAKAKENEVSRGEAFEGLEISRQQPRLTQSKDLDISFPGELGINRISSSSALETGKPGKNRMSFVRNIGNAIRNGKVGSSRMEAKQDPATIEPLVSQTSMKTKIELASKAKLQEILLLEDEPRVLRSIRKEIDLDSGGGGFLKESTSSSNTVAYSITPKIEQEVGNNRDSRIIPTKDRHQIHKQEFVETGIDIEIDLSPRKLYHLLRAVTTNESWNDHPAHPHHHPSDSNAVTLAKDIFDTSDYSRSATSHSHPKGESSGKDIALTAFAQINEHQSTKVKIKGRGKSQSLITSPVPSSFPVIILKKVETSNNIAAMDDSNRKKKNSKKGSRKPMNSSKSQDARKNPGKAASPSLAKRNNEPTPNPNPTPTPLEAQELVYLKESNENSTHIHDTRRIESDKLVGKSYSDVVTSGTSILERPSSTPNGKSSRKSSEEREELRKNAIHEEVSLVSSNDEHDHDELTQDRNGKDESNPPEILLDSKLDLSLEEEIAISPSNTKLHNDNGGGGSNCHLQSESSPKDIIGIAQDQANNNPPSRSSISNTDENENNPKKIIKPAPGPGSTNLTTVKADAYWADIDMRRRESEVGSWNGDDEYEETDPETACTPSFRKLKPFNYNLEPVEEGKKERLYKVLVVGELGAGKTSIIKRYVHQFFSQHYRATIGVDFALKVLRWDPDTVVRLQLWDIAGQERFGSMTRVYYKEAVGAFIVFDVTRSATLEAVPKWKADLDAKVALPDGRPIPTVLLANKSDQPKEGIAANREKMNEFCQQQGFSAWFETSAKDNINIDESANFLVSKILEMDKWSQEPLAPDPDKLDLTANGKHKAASSSNCAC